MKTSRTTKRPARSAGSRTPRWLRSALDYVPEWIEFQMRQSEQPGCSIALAYRDTIVLEAAFGQADLHRGTPLTSRHRFRVASHSKSFTAAALLKLRESKRLRLDDTVGQYIQGLHPRTASVTISQLLSHSAGIVRDGYDTGQWSDDRPFHDRASLLQDLARGPIIDANSRLKYSNHGYGLAGLVLEAITGESFRSWVQREIVAAAGLTETEPDTPLSKRAPVASGHSSRTLLGERVVIPAQNPTHALAPATGFVSTARDLARFYAQLSPKARRSVLSVESRREMIRPQWKAEHSSIERHYGLGVFSGKSGDWNWWGHSGGFQGFITRTSHFPEQELTVCVLTNALEGPAATWHDGIAAILRACETHGGPSGRAASWRGRWWSLWGVTDLLPVGRDKVLLASPNLANPVADAPEMLVTGRDTGRIELDGSFGSHGEEIRRVRTATGRISEIWFAGQRHVSEARQARKMRNRYRVGPAGRRGSR